MGLLCIRMYNIALYFNFVNTCNAAICTPVYNNYNCRSIANVGFILVWTAMVTHHGQYELLV